MAARLPKPGETSWGEVLNGFLAVSHSDNGKLKPGTVGPAQLQADAVGLSKLDAEVRSLLRQPDSALTKAARHDQAMVEAAAAAPIATTAATTTSTLGALQPPYYAPEDYGCLAWGDAAVNDAAIAAAIQDATANNGVVQFTGDGPYNVSQPIVQDVSKFVVRGNKTVLDVSDALASDYFWSLFSSASYQFAANQGAAISGIIITGTGLGSTPINAAAIRVGHSTYPHNSLFRIEDVYVQGFATGFKFIDNAWRIKVANCRVTGGVAIDASGSLVNFGENMVFENCFFESYAPTVTIGTGEWIFSHCSFDNTLVTLSGNCSVKLQGCHLEPHNTYPCINIAHPQAMLTLDNSTLVIDPKVVIKNAAFNVINTNTTYGLIIRNLDTIQSANYTPQVNNMDCLLVSGGGRVDMQGYSSNVNGYSYAIATSNNLIYNGDGEKGNTTGWKTYASYGGPSTFTSDNTVSKYGKTSLKLSSQGGSIYVGQAVPCAAGQWVFAQCWNKFTLDSGTGNTFVNLDFLSASGDVIKTVGYTNTTATTDWVCRRQLTGTTPVAPVGTVSVRVYIGLACSVSASAWYDNIIVNVA